MNDIEQVIEELLEKFPEGFRNKLLAAALVATASLPTAGASRLIGRTRKNRRGTRSLHPWKSQREESHQLCPRRGSWGFLEGLGTEPPQTSFSSPPTPPLSPLP